LNFKTINEELKICTNHWILFISQRNFWRLIILYILILWNIFIKHLIILILINNTSILWLSLDLAFFSILIIIHLFKIWIVLRLLQTLYLRWILTIQYIHLSLVDIRCCFLFVIFQVYHLITFWTFIILNFYSRYNVIFINFWKKHFPIVRTRLFTSLILCINLGMIFWQKAFRCILMCNNIESLRFSKFWMLLNSIFTNL